MYRLQVQYKNRWRWGIVEYDTPEAAAARVEELNRVGIKARIRRSEEIFN